MKEYVIQTEGVLEDDPAGLKYDDVVKISDSMHEVCEENAEWLQSVLILWQSFADSVRSLTSWTDNLTLRVINPVRQLGEGDIDSILLKLMKYRDLERKLADRQATKDAVTYEGEQVFTATGWFWCRGRFEPRLHLRLLIGFCVQNLPRTTPARGRGRVTLGPSPAKFSINWKEECLI